MVSSVCIFHQQSLSISISICMQTSNEESEQKRQVRILYQDKHLTITEYYVVINKYYVPLMTPKTIMFQQLRKITVEDAYNINNTWGTNVRCLNNWFHYDPHRKGKLKFLSFELKESRVKPAATPEDIDQAIRVLREHFESVEWKSMQDDRSVRDNESEADKRSQEHKQRKDKEEEEEDEEEVMGKSRQERRQDESDLNLFVHDFQPVPPYKSSERNRQIKIEDIE